jgi:hypothetical protein
MQITNLARISLYITYIVLHFILVILFANKYRYMKIILGINIIALIVIFFIELSGYLKNKNNLNNDKQINQFIDNSLEFYNFVRYFHLTLTYASFFYIVLFCYICYLVHIGEIKREISFFVITIIVLGLIVVLKEVILQFSRCLYSGTDEKYKLLYHGLSKGRCDNDYNNYWDCINSNYK